MIISTKKDPAAGMEYQLHDLEGKNRCGNYSIVSYDADAEKSVQIILFYHFCDAEAYFNHIFISNQ